MNKLFLGYLLFILSCNTAYNDKIIDQAFFKKTNYKIQNNSFQVVFPLLPDTTELTIPTEKFNIPIIYYTCKVGVNLIYQLSIATYPVDYFKNKNEIDFLSETIYIKEEIDENGIDKMTEISTNKLKGFYFKINNGDIFTEGKVFLKENKLYQITINKDGYYHDEREARIFLDSFQINS